jgi:uncharacterized protein YqgQ
MTNLYSIDHKEVAEAVVRRIEFVKDVIRELDISTNAMDDNEVKKIIVTRTVDNIIDELHVAFQYTGNSEYPDMDTLRSKLRNVFEYEDPHYDILRDEIKKMYKVRLIAENQMLESRTYLVRAALEELNEEEEEKNV